MQQQHQPSQIMIFIALALFVGLTSCATKVDTIGNTAASIDYVAGVYANKEDTDAASENYGEEVDVLVTVEDSQKNPITDLTLSDFYIHHNQLPLVPKNRLTLNYKLSNIKLHLAILIDLRENPMHEQAFTLLKDALSAYLAIGTENKYIQLITYGSTVEVLNEEFSSDGEYLVSLLDNLSQVRTKQDMLGEALKTAEYNLKKFPKGLRALDPRVYEFKDFQGNETPLYESAVFIINYNKFNKTSLIFAADKNNLIIMDTENAVSKEDIASLDEVNYRVSPYYERKLLFNYYHYRPDTLSSVLNQGNAIDEIEQVWKDLSKLTEGFYWLTYNKFASTEILGEQQVRVSLTQYGRKYAQGLLLHAGDEPLKIKEEEALEEAKDNFMDDSSDGSAVSAETAEPLSGDVPTEEELEGLAVSNTLEDTGFDLLPPAVVTGDTWAESMPVNAKKSGIFDPDDSLLALIPGKVMSPQTAVLENPTITDFDLLGPLPDSGEAVIEPTTVADAAPSYEAEPLRLISSEAKESLSNEEKEEAEEQPSENASEDASEDAEVSEELPSLPKEYTNGLYIQVGAFTKLKNLFSVIDDLNSEYKVRSVSSTVKDIRYNRCIVGPFADSDATAAALVELKKMLPESFIIPKPLDEWVGEHS